MYRDLGDELLSRVAQARSAVVLAAPFVKVKVLERLLASVDDSVDVTLVTRWVSAEVAAGVSDLEVWEAMANRQRSQILLVGRLHAKYYRVDDVVLVGSANLTQRALDWCVQPNLELLVEMSASELATFELRLIDESFVATVELRDAIATAAAQLPAAVVVPGADVAPDQLWIPELAAVNRLWDCYRGDRSVVLITAFESGERDLQHLAVPSGLSHEQFMQFVSAAFACEPAFGTAESLARSEAADAAAGRQAMIEAGVAPQDAEAAWDAVVGWVLHFFPDRFRQVVGKKGPMLSRSRVLA